MCLTIVFTPVVHEEYRMGKEDIDLDRGQALIEEIQSDWVRYVGWYYEAHAQNEPSDKNISAFDRYGMVTTAGKSGSVL